MTAKVKTRPHSVRPLDPQKELPIISFHLKDPEFLADAKKSRMDIDPTSGEELEKTVKGLFKLSPAFVAKIKEALAAK